MSPLRKRHQGKQAEGRDRSGWESAWKLSTRVGEGVERPYRYRTRAWHGHDVGAKYDPGPGTTAGTQEWTTVRLCRRTSKSRRDGVELLCQ